MPRQALKSDISILSILDEISDIFLITEPDGEILFANKKWEGVFGGYSTLNFQSFIHEESSVNWDDLAKWQCEVGDGEKIISLISEEQSIDARIRKRQQVPLLSDSIEYQFILTLIDTIPIRIQKNLYEVVVENADDGIYYANASGYIKFMNTLGTDLLGFDQGDIIGSHYTKFIEKSHQAEVEAYYKDQFETKAKSSYLEFPIENPDGNTLWVGQNVRAVANESNPNLIEGYIGIFRDVTLKRMKELELLAGNKLLEEYIFKRTKELKETNAKLRKEIDRREKTEHSLQKKHNEYEQLFQNAHDAIIVFRPKDEVILEANNRACELYGFEREDFIGSSMIALSQDIDIGKEFIERTLKHDGKTTFTTNQKNKRGDHLIIEVNASAIKYRGRKAILSVNRDITTREKLAKQLEEERRQKLHALIDGQELERKRIAQELHDGIGQMLSSLVRLIKKVNAEGSLSSKQYIGLFDAKKLTDATMDEVRRISKNLMPSVLADFGLEAAIQSMVGIINKGDTDITFNCNQEIPRLNPKTEIGIYRIAQEAVNNALKHADAKSIMIEIEQKHSQLRISISDDGKGFRELNPYKNEGGNGITNMMERASLMGAPLELGTVEGGGAQLQLKIDLDE